MAGIASESLHDLFMELNKKFPVLVLRDFDRLPSEWSHDVDILVRPDQLSVAAKVSRFMFDISKFRSSFREMTRFHFWSFSVMCEDRELRVDFFSAISKGWIKYADDDAVRARAVKFHDLFRTPAPSTDSRLLVAAKELLSQGYIRPKYYKLFTDNKVSREDLEESAGILFGNRLTGSGRELVVDVTQNPSMRGRPGLVSGVVLKPRDLMNWLRLRRNGYVASRANRSRVEED